MKYKYNSSKSRYLLAEFDGQVQSLPTAAAAYEGTVYQYVGETDANYTNGYYYKCVEESGVYSWVQTDVQPSGDTIQVTTLPTASASNLGKVYQYIGATNANYTHNYFYECVSDGAVTPTYSWQEVTVQPRTGYKTLKFAGNASTPYIHLQNTYADIWDNAPSYASYLVQMYEGITGDTIPTSYIIECQRPNALTYRSYLTVIRRGVSDMEVRYEGENEIWVKNSNPNVTMEIIQISGKATDFSFVERVASATYHTAAKNFDHDRTFHGSLDDWDALRPEYQALYDFIATPESGEDAEKDIYSTTEVKTNKVWIDGKPIYRKVINCGALPNSTTKRIPTGVSNLETLIDIKGMAYASAAIIPLPFTDLANVTQQIRIYYEISVQSIALSTAVDFSSNYTDSIAIIEYTKTTD